ncbi:MAG TPA: methionine--tRNA ligase [Vicinamibacterales bacterium]|nr:methionine--tRNA ligase [Vicinamibacterales bacterium]
MSRFYLTTAIDYVNSRPHLGTAYEKIAADVIARYKRLAGFDVRFVMGNDEHSQNVFRKATELGLSPLAYCDRMADEFRAVWSRLNISFDDFIRTTERRHKVAVEHLIQRSYEAGDIYAGEYEGWYCVSCEAFKQEKDLTPDGLCLIHKTKPDWIKEKNYFFRLSAYRDRVLAHYAAHPSFLEPESRRNEMLRLLEAGLEDISVSRAGQSWGIPLPFDPTSVVYVWYDALINYAAAVGYGCDKAQFDTWWPADLHIVGKDITRFHCVVWPAMLMSAGVEPPRQVFGHGWVLFKGEKMSKSLGTVVDPFEAAERLGPDPLRWYLTREIAFGQDGDFSWELFEKSYNADLANNLGNLVNRVTSMAHRYRGGVLKGPGVAAESLGGVRDARQSYADAMEKYELSRGAATVMSCVDQANQLIATREPWKLAKAGDDRALDAVLWDASEALRIAAVLLAPFMPASSEEILRRLGVDHDVRTLRLDRHAEWQAEGARTVQQGSLLWPRLEAAPADAAIISTKESRVTDQPNPTVPATPPASAPAPAPAADGAAASPWPLDARLTIDDFMKIDLRVARVLAAERVPNSKKLMKMEIDLGVEKRTIVAGIAEAYEADALVGRHVAIVANLKPAKLMGVESNGMVLAASPDGGKPMLVAFDQPPAPGTRIR